MGIDLGRLMAPHLAPARAWAAWQPSAPYTVGLEEELMLLDAGDLSLAQRSDDVLPRLPAGLAAHVSAETHQAAIELATQPHATVGEAIAELRALRGWIATELADLGLAVAGSGTHPFALWSETRVSPAGRYQVILRTMADLARREPTFALHVHVGVPDPESAVRLLNALRPQLPVLLALAANSPFWQGRATGLASTRTPVFGMFPRTGIPRHFASYDDWVDTVDTLLRCGAFPEPTFLWWDIRPQPALGTVEVRVMDAQSHVDGTAALVALVQSLARLALEDGLAPTWPAGADEVLAENRFLAARDGIEAELLDPVAGRNVPARALLGGMLDAARPHADALGCRDELDLVPALADEPGFARQLDVAAREGGSLPDMLAELARGLVPG
jgi:glutamate---cysteine ligase / carboxylate-amine ligase